MSTLVILILILCLCGFVLVKRRSARNSLASQQQREDLQGDTQISDLEPEAENTSAKQGKFTFWDDRCCREEKYREASLIQRDLNRCWEVFSEQDRRLNCQMITSLFVEVLEGYPDSCILYFYILESAMGWHYDLAISSGETLLEKAGCWDINNNYITPEKYIGTSEFAYISDTLRKLYKMCLITKRFDSGILYADRLVDAINMTLTSDPDMKFASYTTNKDVAIKNLKYERQMASFFSDRLKNAGDTSVIRYLSVPGFDGPEPGYFFDREAIQRYGIDKWVGWEFLNR